VACAAGLASVREIVERKLPENARRVGAHLVTQLDAKLRPLGVVGDIRGKGLMIGVEFAQDPPSRRWFPPDVKFGVKVGRRCLHHGLLLRFDPNWIAFGPALVITEADADRMVDILEHSVREVLREL
jgi:diaminobutyrate-2-oxoglutarate transaminase